MIEVSAHALIRWLERVDGIDVDAVRTARLAMGLPSEDYQLVEALSEGYAAEISVARSMMTEPKVALQASMGASRISIAGHSVMFEGLVAVTVLPPNKYLRRHGRGKHSSNSRKGKQQFLQREVFS